MLKENYRFRNYGGNKNRRTFTDSDMDLYVWFKEGVPERFHLTYNKQGRAHSIGWNNETGFNQRRFFEIEVLALVSGISNILDTFIMVDTDNTPAPVLAYEFLHSSDKIAPWLADFIYARLLECPVHGGIHINQGAALRSF